MAPNRRKSSYSATFEKQKLEQQLAKIDMDIKYGPIQHVELRGVPEQLAIRASGPAMGKYYFAVPVTDTLVCALNEQAPDQSSLLVKEMLLDFDVSHMCDVEVDVTLVNMPTHKRETTVCKYFNGPVFSTVSVGDDSIPIMLIPDEDDVMMDDVEKQHDNNLLDTDNPVVRQLVNTAFGGLPGRDGSYFSAPLEKSMKMKTFKGTYFVNGRKADHTGRVRKDFTHHGVDGGMDPFYASKQSLHFRWDMRTDTEMQIRENGKSVPDTYCALLCGVRPASTLAKYDEDGEASMVGWVENVRIKMYYRVPKGP